MGYPFSLGHTGSNVFPEGRGIIWLDNVDCRGKEKSITECSHSGWGIENCAHSEDVGIICSEEDVTAELRLVNGADQYEGRVEIKIRGEWGTICDDNWDFDNANVVCKQLRYNGAITYLPRAQFGEGRDRIWLDNVNCDGSETNLLDCTYSLGTHDCVHNEDVGVRCQSMYLVLHFSYIFSYIFYCA